MRDKIKDFNMNKQYKYILDLSIPFKQYKEYKISINELGYKIYLKMNNFIPTIEDKRKNILIAICDDFGCINDLERFKEVFNDLKEVSKFNNFIKIIGDFNENSY